METWAISGMTDFVGHGLHTVSVEVVGKADEDRSPRLRVVG